MEGLAQPTLFLKATRREFQPQCSFLVSLHLPQPECDQDVTEHETTS